MSLPGIRKNDKRLTEFVKDVASSLQDGKKFQTPGLGTFSTCTRKAAQGRPACTISMFRPSTELREYIGGGVIPSIQGPHKEILKLIARTMKTQDEFVVPRLGTFVIDSSSVKNTKVSFQGAKELNDSLS